MLLDGWIGKIFTTRCVSFKDSAEAGSEDHSIRRRLWEGIYDWLEIIPVVTGHNAKIMSFYNAQTSSDAPSSLSAFFYPRDHLKDVSGSCLSFS